MKQNKIFFAAIALCLIALFTVSWKPSPINTPSPIAQVFINPTAVWLTTTTTGGTPNAKTGTFQASSQLGTSGHYLMIVDHTGAAFHCTTTFYPAGGGSFITQSNCETTLFDGQWRVVSGTGIYSDLQANGSIVMMPGHEFCTGRIF